MEISGEVPFLTKYIKFSDGENTAFTYISTKDARKLMSCTVNKGAPFLTSYVFFVTTAVSTCPESEHCTNPSFIVQEDNADKVIPKEVELPFLPKVKRTPCLSVVSFNVPYIIYCLLQRDHSNCHMYPPRTVDVTPKCPEGPICFTVTGMCEGVVALTWITSLKGDFFFRQNDSHKRHI